MTTIKEKIAFRLKTLRKYRKIKQKELAHKLGFTASYISNIESGKTPIPVETLIKIAKVLEVDLNFFDPSNPPMLPDGQFII